MRRFIAFLGTMAAASGQVIDVSTAPRNFNTPSINQSFLTTHTEPALPALGPAGYIFKDPTFGNRILRVTDGNTLTSRGFTNDSMASSSSAESSLWRKDGAMFYLGTPVGGGVLLFNFNKTTFQATDTGQMTNGTPFVQVGGSPEFSFNDNNALYGAINLNFVRYDVVAQTFTTLFTFTTAIPGVSGSNGDPSASAYDISGTPDDCLAAPANGPQQDLWKAVIVWCKNTNQYAVLDFTQGIQGFGQSSYTLQNSGPNWDPTWGIHNARIGKEGRYVDITVQGTTAPYQEIWDLKLNTAVAMPYATISGGHKAMGYNNLVSPGKCGTGPDAGPQLSVSFLGTPALCTPSLPVNSTLPGPGGVTDYSSWQSASQTWLTPPMGSNESQSGPGVSGLYLGTGEVTATEVDGVEQRVWRFASTHSPFNNVGPLYTAGATVASAGTGYNMNDTGSVSGCGTADATFQITGVSGGTVTGLTITGGGGQYMPVTGCTTTTTTGSGSGLTLTIPSSFWNNFFDTTRGGVSQDGRYYMFSSTWNGTLGAPPDMSNTFRSDVFIVEITPLTPGMYFRALPGSKQALFRGLAPDMQSCTATIYSDSGRTVQVAQASDTVRDGRTSQILVSGLNAATQYWSKVVCGGGNGTVLSSFSTRAQGSGTYNFPFLLSANQTLKYCADAAMTLSCTTLSAAAQQNVPVATNSAIYAAQGPNGPVAVLLTP